MALPLPALALLVAPVLATPLPQEGPPGGAYPAVEPERVVRFYNLKGDLDIAELSEALRDASLALAFGPVEAASRPSNSVVGISAPVGTKPRELERALRKAGVKPEALEAFLFRGRIENGFPTFGIGLKKIDYMLGMSGDVRWCDMVGEWTAFYCVAGELDAAAIEDRWQKLQRPLGTEPATLGTVVADRLEWTLPEELDERRAARLEKAVAKLEGVTAVEVEGARLTVTVELAGLEASGPLVPLAGDAAEAPRRVTWATDALWALLVDEGLAPGGG